MTFGWLRGPCVVTLVTLASLTGALLAAAEDAEITHRRSIERKTFSNAEIIDGLFKVTFGASINSVLHASGSNTSALDGLAPMRRWPARP